jgi:uncharacterized protein YkwD
MKVKGAKAVRLVVALAVLAAMGLLATSAFATPSSETDLDSLNHQVLAQLNSFRIAHGLAPLHESPALDRSARQHSLQMGRLGYFAHPSADGTSFWRRIQHYYPVSKYSYWYVGENLLWAAPSVTAGHAMRDWISSPPHLQNLLAPQWRQIGISAVRVLRAPGVFGRRRVTIITTDFGVRRS